MDPGIRGRRSGVRGFVDPWGVRGFVNGFVHSWVRELVAGFVDWFARFRVRGVSFCLLGFKSFKILKLYCLVPKCLVYK